MSGPAQQHLQISTAQPQRWSQMIHASNFELSSFHLIKFNLVLFIVWNHNSI